jgi:hypothetical protein
MTAPAALMMSLVPSKPPKESENDVLMTDNITLLARMVFDLFAVMGSIGGAALEREGVGRAAEI